MQQQRSGQARAVLTEVQNRHDDMKKIEKTIIVSFWTVWCNVSRPNLTDVPVLGTATIVYGHANAC